MVEAEFATWAAGLPEAEGESAEHDAVIPATAIPTVTAVATFRLV